MTNDESHPPRGRPARGRPRPPVPPQGTNRSQRQTEDESSHEESGDAEGSSHGIHSRPPETRLPEAPASRSPHAPSSRTPYSSYASSAQDGARRFIVEDLGDFAKMGGDLLKRTVSSGFDVIKEVKKDLPKEASHLINKGKEEVLKGLSKDVMQNVLAQTVDRFFAIVREHKLDVTVSVRLKKADDPTVQTKVTK